VRQGEALPEAKRGKRLWALPFTLASNNARFLNKFYQSSHDGASSWLIDF
jgi:hypothetical protein